MMYMKSLTVSGQTYQVRDPEAVSFAQDRTLTPAQQASAREHLGVLSAKELLDRLCPSFTASGTVVACTPVEGYPLEVASAVKLSNPNLLPNNIYDVNSWETGSETYPNAYVLDDLEPGIYTLYVGEPGGWICVMKYDPLADDYVTLDAEACENPDDLLGYEGHSWAAYKVESGDKILIWFNEGEPTAEILANFKLESGIGYTGTNYNAPTIYRCGKNLVKLSEYAKASQDTTLDGEVFTTNFGNASLKVNVPWAGKQKTNPKGTYTVTFIPVSEGACASIYAYAADDGTTIANKLDAKEGNGTSLTFTAKEEFYISLGGAQNKADRGTHSYKLQLEVGSVATAYEPFRDRETFQAGDPILALSGVNTLWASRGDITVTGRADPVAIINRLTDAVTALGGGE